MKKLIAVLAIGLLSLFLVGFTYTTRGGSGVRHFYDFSKDEVITALREYAEKHGEFMPLGKTHLSCDYYERGEKPYHLYIDEKKEILKWNEESGDYR